MCRKNLHNKARNDKKAWRWRKEALGWALDESETLSDKGSRHGRAVPKRRKARAWLTGEEQQHTHLSKPSERDCNDCKKFRSALPGMIDDSVARRFSETERRIQFSLPGNQRCASTLSTLPNSRADFPRQPDDKLPRLMT